MSDDDVPEWMKPSEALKRIAAAKIPEQFRRCVKCEHRHAGVLTCDHRKRDATFCMCTREVLE